MTSTAAFKVEKCKKYTPARSGRGLVAAGWSPPPRTMCSLAATHSLCRCVRSAARHTGRDVVPAQTTTITRRRHVRRLVIRPPVPVACPSQTTHMPSTHWQSATMDHTATITPAVTHTPPQHCAAHSRGVGDAVDTQVLEQVDGVAGVDDGVARQTLLRARGGAGVADGAQEVPWSIASTQALHCGVRAGAGHRRGCVRPVQVATQSINVIMNNIVIGP